MNMSTHKPLNAKMHSGSRKDVRMSVIRFWRNPPSQPFSKINRLMPYPPAVGIM